jgi:hypothetical protein
MVSEYTNYLTAKQLIEYIATDYVELSHEKILAQRNEHIKMCREWLEHNVELDDDVSESQEWEDHDKDC